MDVTTTEDTETTEDLSHLLNDEQTDDSPDDQTESPSTEDESEDAGGETPAQDETSGEGPGSLLEALAEAEKKTDVFYTLESTIKDVPGAPEALGELRTAVQERFNGFDKLHEQVKAVRETCGVESLTDVIPILENASEIYEAFSELKDPVKAVSRVQTFVSEIMQATGFDIDDITEIMGGESPPLPNPAMKRSEALAVLGLTESTISSIAAIEQRRAWDATERPIWQALSEKFDLDLEKVYELSSKYPNMSRAEIAKLLELPSSQPSKPPAHIPVKKTTSHQGKKEQVISNSDDLRGFIFSG